MEKKGRGALLYTYRPILANPMTVALLLLVLVVTFGIGPIVAGPEGLWPLGGVCFAPLAVVLLAMALFKPSPTLVFEDGIEVSLPLWRRLLGRARYINRKSTRLNSSHLVISYAVFCLKKKQNISLVGRIAQV